MCIKQSLKRKVSLFVIVLLLTSVSCGKRAKVLFDEIEKEISVNPSSAYERLQEIDAENLWPESSRARYALLMSLAMDKSYIDVADDSLVQIAVRYYQDRKDTYHKMLALYSLGRVQRNANNKPGAIVSFLRAKELAESIPEYHYWGLITRNMAELYGSSQDYDMELLFYKESADAFWENNEPFYAAYSLRGMARSHMSKGQYDLADSLLIALGEYAQKEKRKSLLSSVLKDRALIQMTPKKKDPKSAISLYYEAAALGYPIKQTVDYGTMATAYEFLEQKDSVKQYLDLADRSAKTILDSIHVCNTKYRIFNHRHIYQEANTQLERGVQLHNKLVFNAENQQLANAVSDYRRKEAVRQSEIAKYRLVLLVITAIAIVALLGVILLVVINRKRQIKEKNRIILEKEQKIEEELAYIQEISDQLQIASSSQSEMAKSINDLISEKIAIVKICADSYESVKSDPKYNPRDPYCHLDEDPRKKKDAQMKEFLLALDKFRKDEALFSVLEESVNKWRDNIMRHLRDACSKEKMVKPRLSEDDFRIIMLTYAGIPDRTIAFLMDMTCAAVRTRKTRYKERLLRPDISDGSFFVQGMAFFPRIEGM